MKIGDVIATKYAGVNRTGKITGKHGSADYFAVRLDSGDTIYRWAADMELYSDDKPTYNNGREFWIDLLLCYGKPEATRIANSYLDMPMKDSDSGEYDFRRELYAAMFA